MIAVIDNYDSFTYNLVQYLGELGAEVKVYRNDQVTVDAIAADNPDKLLISPGPCTPDKAGISLDAIDRFKGLIPILGVCLGHQSIGQYFGGRIVRATRIMHGKLSSIHHNGEGVFNGLPAAYTATRYHSLVIEQTSLPECLALTAWTEEPASVGGGKEIMGVRHREYNIEGVQFHPESISSEHGHRLLENFLNTDAGTTRSV